MYKMYLIGKNISHSNSPALYNEYFKIHNINCHYDLLDIESNIEFESFIKNLKNKKDIIAFNITMPYKQAIHKYIDVNDDISNICNSNNLVKIINNKLYGYNTDGIGFANYLKSLNIDISNKNICIIGNGGAGKSIISTLNTIYNNKNILVINHEYSNKLFNKEVNINDINNYDIIINASNTGFGNDKSLPIPEWLIDSITNKNTYIFDIIYNPKNTNFMKKFLNNGFKNVYNGEGMLKYQFLENIKILFN